MKKYKLLIATFMFMFVFAAVSTSALSGQTSYAGITLPSLRNEVMEGPMSKTTDAEQKYNNFSTINSCTNNSNEIGVRVKSQANGFSDRKTISVDSTASLGSNYKTKTIAAYNIYLRNNVISPCAAYHSGIWYFN